MIHRSRSRSLLASMLILVPFCSTACSGEAEPPADASPRLGVLIVVDQMRADYLTTYSSAFEDGLRILLEEGTNFENAWVDHAYTNSLPGHATVVTGSYPRSHGVTDNVWHEWGDSSFVVRSGFSLLEDQDGARSGLDRTTIAEWFSASQPGARFAAIGSNEAARIYAGALEGPVYWLSDEGDGYVASAAVDGGIPGWVRSFNTGRLTELASQEWTSELPSALQERLRADDVSFENGGEDTHFPHRSRTNEQQPLEWVYQTPFADRATLELAVVAVRELGLGTDDVPDVLTISLNAFDEIGHAYGPFSHEQTDLVIKLDRSLGEFLRALDDLVGPGRWTLALTADHGVAPTPEGRRLLGSAEGRRISRETAREVAEAAYAAANAVEGAAQRTAAAAAAIENFDFVERVFTADELAQVAPDPTTFEGLFALSYRPGRMPVHPFYVRDLPIAELGLFVLLEEDIMMDWATAIHGSPYDYDRRVPVAFLGAGVGHATRYDRVATVDVAPTLAATLGVQPNGAVDGRVLEVGKLRSVAEGAALAGEGSGL